MDGSFDFATATADGLLEAACRSEAEGDYSQSAVCLQKAADMGDLHRQPFYEH